MLFRSRPATPSRRGGPIDLGRMSWARGRSSVAMAPTIAALRVMSEDDLIRGHDSLCHRDVPLDFYLDEMRRRQLSAQKKQPTNWLGVRMSWLPARTNWRAARIGLPLPLPCSRPYRRSQRLSGSVWLSAVPSRPGRLGHTVRGPCSWSRSPRWWLPAAPRNPYSPSDPVAAKAIVPRRVML